MTEAVETLKTLNVIKSKVGTTIGSGECYGLVALYSEMLGVVTLGVVSIPQTPTETGDKLTEAIRRGA